MEDLKDNSKIFAEKITYFKNDEKIITNGKSKSLINNKYIFYSKDLIYDKKNLILSSLNYSHITDDNSRLYKADKFEYIIQKELLKGKNIEVISENFLQNGFSDSAKFSNGFFNIGNNEFIAGKTKINLKKNTLDEPKNNPRLYGASSSNDKDKLIINKGIFTSCNINMNCPAWAIKAKKIEHDRKTKRIIYDDAILKIYNMPVMYMPKFFHPDPSVKRQSGFLQPLLNGSSSLTDSIYIPYYKVISESKDVTVQTTLFEDKKILLQNEYREKKRDSNITADFGYVSKYKGKNSKKKNSIFHLFLDYEKDLNLDQYTSSSIKINLEKVTNDTYLKVFENNLVNTDILPNNKSNINSKIEFTLDNDDYQLDAGFEMYENLEGVSNNDKYEYDLPYYNFSKSPILLKNFLLNINSSGSNELSETNKLTSKIVNNFNVNSVDLISKLGFQNNLNLYFKNTNFLGKNNELHENSLQSKFKTIFEANTTFPLIKRSLVSNNYLIPKASFRINPGDMKNRSTEDRNVDISNIFNIDRTSLGDEFESGKSLTLGVDFKKENLDDINKYFSFKLATAFREKEENFIPNSSTLNKKTSNLFGSVENNFNEIFNLGYEFSLDNNYKTFEYNSIISKFKFGKLNTNFTFTEKSGDIGDVNILSNETKFNFDDNHSISFKTRRNRKISLTEYYDLVYNYKNDCFKAGFKYKKSYYEDRDLKPTEDLLLTLTISPITSYEHKIDQDLFRD